MDIRQTFQGITRVDIVNRKENAVLRSGKTRGTVSVKGALRHSVHGLSQSADTLYLVAFDGTVTLPDNVEVRYTRGVKDIQRTLVDMYAPGLEHGELAETRRMAKSMIGFKDIAPDETMKITRLFTESTTRSFFASQAEVSAPPNLERLKRKMQGELFRWNGQYQVKAVLQRGSSDFIPEFSRAKTSDELWKAAQMFMAHKMAFKGPSLAGLIAETNALSFESVEKLIAFLREIQPEMLKVEALGQELATNSRKQAEDDLAEGLEELRKQKVPYAAWLAEAAGNAVGPISMELWAPIMAKTAAHEASLRRKGPPSTRGSKKVLKGHVGLREVSDWETGMGDKGAFAICMSAFAARKLRGEMNGWDGTASGSTADVSRWVADATSAATARSNRLKLDRDETEQVEFYPDVKKNRVNVAFTGRSCNERFRNPSPTPSPSPSPSSPPTKSTEKGFIQSWRDFLNI